MKKKNYAKYYCEAPECKNIETVPEGATPKVAWRLLHLDPGNTPGANPKPIQLCPLCVVDSLGTTYVKDEDVTEAKQVFFGDKTPTAV